SLIFFFQAADGIRDFHVTGVQTCALPISKEKPLNVDVLMNESRTFLLKCAKLSFSTSCAMVTADKFKNAASVSVVAEPRVYILRSEERRVGKEGTSGCLPE